MKTIKKLLSDTKEQFRVAGVDNPSLDARLLLQEVLSASHEEILLNNNRVIGDIECNSLKELVGRRLNREPISRILGKRAFWKSDFKLSPETLDPRADSETIINSILGLFNKDTKLDILDLGTGSGCILLSLLSELPKSKGVGVDISSGAIDIAEENSKHMTLLNRVHFINSDWQDLSLNKLFDIVVSNPPYIENDEIAKLEPEVKDFDPHIALSGGNDGLDCYRSIIKKLPDLLKKDGRVFFEIGYNQADSVNDLLVQNDFFVIETIQDLAKCNRCIVAKWN